MSEKSFQHYLSILQYPAMARVKQADFDKQRMADIEAIARLRPHYMLFQHTLPAAAQTLAIGDATEPVNHDTVITGAITDGQNRNIRFYRNAETNAIVRFGKEVGVNLSLDAIAGHSVASAGFAGILDFPEPFLIPAFEFMTIDMFQETSPGAPEIISTVLCGSRIYSAQTAEATLSDPTRKAVEDAISRRSAPETRLSVCKVAFDANGEASAETPKSPEPQVILGFRSTFTDALINLGFDSDNSFSKGKFPIWALCNEPNNSQNAFQLLKGGGLFVPQNMQLKMSLKNTIDGVLFATNGNIEVLVRTP